MLRRFELDCGKSLSLNVSERCKTASGKCATQHGARGHAGVDRLFGDADVHGRCASPGMRNFCDYPLAARVRDSQRDLCSGMQLEQAQGCVDPQARAQLDRLRQQTAALSKAGGQQQQQDLTSPQPVDELAIAGQLDRYGCCITQAVAACNNLLLLGDYFKVWPQFGWAVERPGSTNCRC